jgi:hypothetical protein
MKAKDIWYGVLDAGEKTSPVVRDATLDASQGKVWLYNHVRNQFIEYARTIVESKLRELDTGDIPQEELDEAFKAARQAFSSSRKISTWSDTEPATSPVKNQDVDDELDIDISDDDDIEDFNEFDEQ